MEHCAIEIYKVNFKEFDEEISLRFFITCYYKYQDKMIYKITKVDKNIVKAYNILLLSLKVMNAFLREKKKLIC